MSTAPDTIVLRLATPFYDAARLNAMARVIEGRAATLTPDPAGAVLVLRGGDRADPVVWKALEACQTYAQGPAR